MKHHARTREDFEETIVPLLRDDVPKDLEVYERSVERGMETAEFFLAGKVAFENPIPSVDDLKRAHEFAYGAVYRNAGEFRTDERGIEDQKTGRVWEGAFSANVERELEQLTAEAREMVAEATTAQDFAQAIVYYHTKFETIHPFEDGNGRLGRALAEAQAESLLDRPLALLPGDEVSYGAAFKDAREKGDLAFMASVLLGFGLDEGHLESPHPIEVWPQEVERTLPSGREITLTAANVDEAQKFASKELSPDIDRYIEAFGAETIALTDDDGGRIDLNDECRRELDRGQDQGLEADFER